MDGILIGILYLVSLTFIITFFFVFLLNNRGPWGNFWAFFVIILLAVFAADVWIGPVGPYFYDEIYWVPPLAVGLLFALLLAATTPSPKTRSKLEMEKNKLAENQNTPVAIGTFFWFLFVLMLIIVTVGLFNKYY
jgi:hypothetical protein